MMGWVKKLFCYHKWKATADPYIWNGMTKRVWVKCVKCGAVSNVDIFRTPKKRWAKDE